MSPFKTSLNKGLSFIKSKRGQVTPFIIIGILIVIIVGAVVFINREEISSSRVTSAQVEPVREYLRNCVEGRMGSLLLELRQYGGYSREMSTPPLTRDIIDWSGLSPVNILLKNVNGAYVPSENNNVEFTIAYEVYAALKNGNCKLSNLQNEFSQFEIIQTRMMDCDFDSCEDIEVIITDEDITINLNIPYTIKRGDFSTELGKIPYKIDDKFGKYKRISSEVINHQITGESYNSEVIVNSADEGKYRGYLISEENDVPFLFVTEVA